LQGSLPSFLWKPILANVLFRKAQIGSLRVSPKMLSKLCCKVLEAAKKWVDASGAVMSEFQWRRFEGEMQKRRNASLARR
jgi:hypothetical protein